MVYSSSTQISSLKIFMLGWPMLVVVWAYFLWWLRALFYLSSKPVEGGDSLLATNWLVVLLPIMCVPTFVVWAYTNWLGWKFFQRN